MQETLVVELRKISKHFGEVVALDQVCLEIRDGEFFSLLGPSGCGKTTEPGLSSKQPLAAKG